MSRRRRTTTLLDIARAAETSVSTVSRVLTGSAASRRISDATRRRVVSAAERLGYRPNLVARGLRTRRSHTVALLVSDIANPFFAQIGRWVEQRLHDAGYSLVLCNSAEDPQREREYLHLLPLKGIDGLIAVPIAESAEQLRGLLPPDLPVVLLDRPVRGLGASVSTDQAQATRILADALAGRGVRRIAVVCGPDHIATHRRRRDLLGERFRMVACHAGPAEPATGAAAFARLGSVERDAVVCTNNLLAQGWLEAAGVERAGLCAFFDALPGMDLLPVPIAVSMQDVPGLASGAVDLLLPQLRGEAAPASITLQATLRANAAFAARL